MAMLPDGRHAIPVPNSRSRCLLENWVEERAVQEIDAEKAKRKPNTTSTAQLMKDGHDGLLTTAFCSHTDDLTTHLNSYKPRQDPPIRQKGSRAEALQQMLFEKAKREIEAEREEEENREVEQRSVTNKDFGIDDFVPMKPTPTAYHDYVNEQPVTIWTELRGNLQGVTQSKMTFDSAFRRNAAFSRPISEAWDTDKVMPYQADHVPNM